MSDKTELGFDVRPIPKPDRNENRGTDQNRIQNPYAKKYMENKKITVMKENVVEMLTNIKNKRGFNSRNDTVKFLCDLEKTLTDANMIKEFAVCEDCGEVMSAKHTKEIHSHVDKDSECFGCLQKEHRFYPDKDVILRLADKIRTKDEQKDQTDKQSDQTDTNDEIDKHYLKD